MRLSREAYLLGLARRCLPFQEMYLDLSWIEVFFKHPHSILLIKCLARKNIQINIICLFNKVCCYIGCLNELHKAIPFFISFTETNNRWTSKCYHINFSHQFFRELTDCRRRSYCFRYTISRIYNKMISPVGTCIFLQFTSTPLHLL